MMHSADITCTRDTITNTRITHNYSPHANLEILSGFCPPVICHWCLVFLFASWLEEVGGWGGGGGILACQQGVIDDSLVLVASPCCMCDIMPSRIVTVLVPFVAHLALLHFTSQFYFFLFLLLLFCYCFMSQTYNRLSIYN